MRTKLTIAAALAIMGAMTATPAHAADHHAGRGHGHVVLHGSTGQSPTPHGHHRPGQTPPTKPPH